MILPFSTQLNGKPSYFPEKIITGLKRNNIISTNEAKDLFQIKTITRNSKTELYGFTAYILKFDGTQLYNPKLHTVRGDLK